MQNSGIGNAVNPLVSLANKDVYGVPILFIEGWRGVPGVRDEPQHVFQGKITCELFDTLDVYYSVVDENITNEEMLHILDVAFSVLGENRQYAIIVKKGTFEKAEPFVWNKGNQRVRENVLGHIIETLPKDVELYLQHE